MGCDIHSFAEVKRNNKWEKIEDNIFPEYGDNKTSEPFNWRSYSLFGFLAGVRNYDHCKPLSECRGLPEDSEYLNSPSEFESLRNYQITEGSKIETIKEDLYESGFHSFSYLYLNELLEFDYYKTFWNRRVSKQTGPNSWNGASLAELGEGKIVTYKENLGEDYFKILDVLKTLGKSKEVRIIFYFDS